jgi:hypothetical protein
MSPAVVSFLNWIFPWQLRVLGLAGSKGWRCYQGSVIAGSRYKPVLASKENESFVQEVVGI